MLFETYDEQELNRTEYVNKSMFLKWEEEYTKANLAMLKSIRDIKEESGITKSPSSVKVKIPKMKIPTFSIPETDSNRRSRVNAYLQRIMTMKNCDNESANAMKNLLDTTTDCLNGLKSSGVDTNNWDAIIVYIIVNKLDSISLKKWEELLSRENEDSLPTLVMLTEFLKDRIRTIKDSIMSNGNVHTEDFVNSIESKEEKDDVNIVKKSVYHTHTRKEILCTYCDSEHRIYNCQHFKSLSYEEKRSFIGSKRLCLNCLAPHHRAKQCKHYIRCKFCGGKHNSFIHLPSRRNKGKMLPKVCRREEAFRKIQSTNEEEVLKHFVELKKFERNRQRIKEIKNMRNVNKRSTKIQEMSRNRELDKKQNGKLGKYVHRSSKKVDNVHRLKKYYTKEINEKKICFSTSRVLEGENNKEGSQRLVKDKLVYSRSQLNFLNNIHI